LPQQINFANATLATPIASARIEGITLPKQFEQKLTGYMYDKKILPN